MTTGVEPSFGRTGARQRELSASGVQKLCVRLAQPGSNVVGDALRKLPHLSRFAFGDSTGSLVASDVPLLPKSVESADDPSIRADRELERLDDPVVVLIAARPEPGRRQCRSRRLEGGVVRDVEPPVGGETRSLAIGQVAVDDGEKIRDLPGARAVGQYPTVSLPVAQGHRDLLSRTEAVPS